MEYDQRAHRLDTLASFSFWVTNVSPYLSQPNSPSPPFLLTHAPKLRVVSAQSIDSRTSTLEPPEAPLSPMVSIHNLGDTLSPGASQTTAPREPIKVDISCPRPAEDVTVSDDGPVFRATMKALELKTGNMRLQMKKVIRRAETAQNAQVEASDAFNSFIEALKEASSTNANAVQPAIEHYFDKIAREILAYERQNAANLQRMIIDPLNKLYTFDIKQAENKKRDFEEESKEYYSYVGRYLGQKQDAKTKKLADSDNKYQNKRRNFELKRFDYSTFMQDLSGGRKEQEVLSHLTRFADAQARCFLNVSKKVESLLPELEALSGEVQQADKEYQYQRREREEKRRQLEKSNLSYVEPDPTISVTAPAQLPAQATTNNPSYTEPELGRADSTGSGLNIGAPVTPAVAGDMARSPGSLSHNASVGSPSQNSKFRGIRDLEDRDLTRINSSEKNGTQRKEGLLWALNRPGSHVDPRSLNKQAWHKSVHLNFIRAHRRFC
jgi:Arf-GAP/SH3 domain/ANK repeat/PH domain-containing protein